VSEPVPIGKIILLVRLVADVLAGDKKDALAVAKELAMLAIEMVPVDELKAFLSDRDRIFADLSADLTEEAKLQGDTE